MTDSVLAFEVTRLAAAVPHGVPLTWRGRAFDSGPLAIELSPRAPSRGALDYASGRARAEFHVRLSFPEFARTVEDLGLDPALGEPVEAVLRSEGDILEDHGFALHGRCELAPHALLPREETSAAVLPGR
jgi:hypothetical protein